MMKKFFKAAIVLFWIGFGYLSAQEVTVVDQIGTKHTVTSNTVTTTAIAPTSPVDGDVWFDTTSNTIKIYESATARWKEMDTHSVTVTATIPNLPTEGDVWFDTASNTTKIYDGSSWQVIQTSSNTDSQTLVLGSGTGSNTLIELTQSDGTTSTITLSAGPGITLTEDTASNVVTITAASGSDSQTLAFDSASATATQTAITLDNSQSITLTASGSLRMSNTNSTSLELTVEDTNTDSQTLAFDSASATATQTAITLDNSQSITLTAIGSLRLSNTNSTSLQLTVEDTNTDRQTLTVTATIATATGSASETIEIALENSSNASYTIDLSSLEEVVSGTTTPAVHTFTKSPTQGDLFVNTTSNTLWTYSGTTWNQVVGAAWRLTRNAGTNSSTNFLGTTDAQPLAFRTNNEQRMIIAANGKVGVGTGTPSASLHIAPPNLVPTVYVPMGTAQEIVTGFEAYSNANLTLYNATQKYGANALLFNSATESHTAVNHILRYSDGQDWGVGYRFNTPYFITGLRLQGRDDPLQTRTGGGEFRVYRNGALVFTSATIASPATAPAGWTTAVTPNLIADEVRYIFANGANSDAGDGMFNASEFEITGQQLSGEKEIGLVSEGNVGIKTVSPTQALDVAGQARIRTLKPATGLASVVVATASGVLQTIRSGSYNETIHISTDVTAAQSYSDKKIHIEPNGKLTLNGSNLSDGFSALLINNSGTMSSSIDFSNFTKVFDLNRTTKNIISENRFRMDYLESVMLTVTVSGTNNYLNIHRFGGGMGETRNEYRGFQNSVTGVVNVNATNATLNMQYDGQTLTASATTTSSYDNNYPIAGAFNGGQHATKGGTSETVTISFPQAVRVYRVRARGRVTNEYFQTARIRLLDASNNVVQEHTGTVTATTIFHDMRFDSIVTPENIRKIEIFGSNRVGPNPCVNDIEIYLADNITPTRINVVPLWHLESSAFYGKEDVINHNGILYRNKTGTNTTMNPSLDTTNWEVYPSVNDLTNTSEVETADRWAGKKVYRRHFSGTSPSSTSVTTLISGGITNLIRVEGWIRRNGGTQYHPIQLVRIADATNPDIISPIYRDGGNINFYVGSVSAYQGQEYAVTLYYTK